MEERQGSGGYFGTRQRGVANELHKLVVGARRHLMLWVCNRLRNDSMGKHPKGPGDDTGLGGVDDVPSRRAAYGHLGSMM